MSAAQSQQTPPFYADRQNLLVYADGHGVMHPVKSVADWQKRRAHILANMQQVMGEMPVEDGALRANEGRRVPPQMQVVEEVQLPKFVRRKITFSTEKDDRVPAYLLIPHGLKGNAPAMLCLHQTTAIGKAEPAGMGPKPNLHYAKELAERGYVALAPDYPGYGDYKIDVYARGYVSATMKGIWNHMRAIDLLQSLPEVDKDRIGCIGHSLGGHNSLFVAVFDERIKVVVTSCGFNSFFKYHGGDLTGWSHAGYMPRIAAVYGKAPAKMPFDFTEIIAAIAPKRLFINAPLRDSCFEVSGVRDCVAAAKPVYALFGASRNMTAVYPDSDHDFPLEVREAAYGFLDAALK